MISTGLSDNIINKITDVFKSYYQVEKVVLYGSRAKGTYKKGSDIDLTMLGSELSFQLLLDISDKIDELLLPYMIDLSIFDNLTNDKLKEHINRVGIVFYERKLPLKQGWELKKLGDIGNLYNGNSIKENVKKNKYTGIENGLPFIATKDVSFENKIDYNNGVKIPFNEINIFKVAPKNTVLICAEGGSAGRKIGYTNQDVCFGNKLFALTTNKSIDSRFVYYYYLSSSFQKDFTTELVGIIGGVSMSKFKELKIPIPPLPEQQKIVSILDKVFTAIDQAKQHVEQNIQNAKELFNSYLSGIFTNKGKTIKYSP